MIKTPEVTPENWESLDSQTQEDLLTWYNVAEPDTDDLLLLVELNAAGRFRAWYCPKCGERVYEGDPEDWNNFQGVQQVDYCSYPGDDEIYQEEYLREMCDTCRCWPRRPWKESNW